MADVFNEKPSAFISLNTLFNVLNDKVGLTDEQLRVLVENTNFLYNNLGLADISVGEVNTIFTSPGTFSSVELAHREEKVGEKTYDLFDYTFYIPTPKIETEWNTSTTTDPANAGISMTQTPIYETQEDGQNIIVGYTFAFDARTHIVDISGKEDLANKVAQITEENKASEVAYPSVKAMTDYVDSAVGAIDAWLQNLYDGEGV